jgi:hypothetical protein
VDPFQAKRHLDGLTPSFLRLPFAARQVSDELKEINNDVFNEMEQRIKKAEEKERDASAKTDGSNTSS